MSKNWKCIECGTAIWNRSIRCKKCAYKGTLNSNYGKGLLGINNPNWRGGIAKNPYTGKFKREIRLHVLKRYPTCQWCNSNKDLVVHHINHDRKDNTVFNLITLCRSCNSREMFNQITYNTYFIQKATNSFLNLLYF